ncbi:MAG: S8 family peptidase [Bacteroidota bacterium]|nr:S8 family peptidase [Bacteroidota bacterium]
MNWNRCFRIFILLTGLLFLPRTTEAQQNIYIVKFKDKNSSPYSINRPSEFLSQKAIDRRQRQHIVITSEDLPVNPAYKNAIMALGVKIRLELKWFNSIVVQTGPDKASLIQTLGFVESLTSLGPVPSLFQATVKPFFKNESTDNPYLKKSMSAEDYGSAETQIEQLNGHLLHQMGLLGKGMTIAVLDAGFCNLYTLAVFDSLRLNGRLKGAHDFTYMPNFLTGQDATHGSEVLSLMAGWLNNLQIGTAPNADYYLLRTEDNSSESPVEEYNWAAGAAYADSVGADIISSSLGYTVFDPTYEAYDHTYPDLNGHTAYVTRAATMAAGRGILIVNAAGNEGNSKWKHIVAPADADSILAVGAVNTKGVAAAFTSLGPTVDGRIKPDVAACGLGTTLANPLNSSLISANGTSFSTPLIAGLCACLWQGNPGVKNVDIINALRLTASQSASPDNVLGYGIASFYRAYLLLKKMQINASPNKPAYLLSANPFRENMELVITSPSPSGWTIDLFTMQGKLVERFVKVSSNEPILIGSKIRSGIYLLRILSGNQIAIEKIIKE